MKTIRRISSIITPGIKKKRVAAYCRVSMETERLQHSLFAQITFYSNLIQSNPAWVYSGVYADDGLSGTNTDRPDFQRMLADCDKGMIDIILTKSISRFARNTVDLLNTVRHLRDLGIEIRFEKEGINSLDKSGEFMLTLLASFAQEESRSISENIKWAVRKNFQRGITRGHLLYGYRWDGNKYVIFPPEAKIVKMIFQNYLDGFSAEETERQLKEMGVVSLTGGAFTNKTIRPMLQNEKYTGCMLLQKRYTEDSISHRKKRNTGELPKYYVENTHEPIIDRETFDKVQKEIQRRRQLGNVANKSVNTSCLTNKIFCGNCGAAYFRHNRNTQKDGTISHIWKCSRKVKEGTSSCSAKDVPEAVIKSKFSELAHTSEFDPAQFEFLVDKIVVIGDDILEFHFKDGAVYSSHWFSTARKDYWTPERRRQRSEQYRSQNRGDRSCNAQEK